MPTMISCKPTCQATHGTAQCEVCSLCECSTILGDRPRPLHARCRLSPQSSALLSPCQYRGIPTQVGPGSGYPQWPWRVCRASVGGRAIVRGASEQPEIWRAESSMLLLYHWNCLHSVRRRKPLPTAPVLENIRHLSASLSGGVSADQPSCCTAAIATCCDGVFEHTYMSLRRPARQRSGLVVRRWLCRSRRFRHSCTIALKFKREAR